MYQVLIWDEKGEIVLNAPFKTFHSAHYASLVVAQERTISRMEIIKR